MHRLFCKLSFFVNIKWSFYRVLAISVLPALVLGKLFDDTIEAVFDATANQVTLNLDGKLEGTRPFTPSKMSFDEVTVGARFYTNGPGAQEVRGPFQGDIAELLVYNRVLTDAETTSVRQYLNRKYGKLAEELPEELKLASAGGVPLVKAKNPPAIQMLQPGFSEPRSGAASVPPHPGHPFPRCHLLEDCKFADFLVSS